MYFFPFRFLIYEIFSLVAKSFVFSRSCVIAFLLICCCFVRFNFLHDAGMTMSHKTFIAFIFVSDFFLLWYIYIYYFFVKILMGLGRAWPKLDPALDIEV